MKPEYKPFVDALIELAIREDIGDGDHTSLCCIPATEKGRRGGAANARRLYRVGSDVMTREQIADRLGVTPRLAAERISRARAKGVVTWESISGGGA